MQVLSFNDCVMRTKHTHKYALLFDVDEFLYVNATAFGTPGMMVELPIYLDHTFNDTLASLEFVSWQYPKNCPATIVGSFFERHKFRELQALRKKNGKVIVRPRHVLEVYVHFAVSWEDGWQQKKVVTTDTAFVKHIIWKQAYYVRCSDYVHEDTDEHPKAL